MLNDHESGLAWMELAGALPELALEAGTDLDATFEAARIAEEMAVPPALDAEATNASPAVAWPTLDGITFDIDLVAQILAIGFGIFVLVILLRGQPRASTPELHTAPTATRCREARSLANGGVPLYEIARRTGLARDAVSVLLSRSAR